VADTHRGLRSSWDQGLLDDKSLLGEKQGRNESLLLAGGFKLSNAAEILVALVVVLETSLHEVLLSSVDPVHHVEVVGLVEQRVGQIDLPILLEELWGHIGGLGRIAREHLDPEVIEVFLCG
jgi:hypothetical protein